MSEALELIASGTVPVDDLVTHRFPLQRIGEAFELFENARGNSLKIIIQPNNGA
jgi:L-iditol 2-dehydrogenase